MTPRLCAALALLLLAGCASDPAPVAQLQLTEEALQQARAVGAGDEQAELKSAEAGLSAARAAFAGQEYRSARMLAERAELDARLAEARTLTAKSSAQLAEVKGGIKRLRTELGGQP